MTELDATHWDACVIGAGPAGALAALRLAGAGRSVLLIDKAVFPRPKVCGGCLGGVGLAALAGSGLRLADMGVAAEPLHSVTIHAGSERATLPLRQRRAIDRESFDAALVDRAGKGGARFIAGTRASVGECVDGHRRVSLRSSAGKNEIRARVIVVAAGLGGVGVLSDRESLPVVRRSNARVGAGALVNDSSAAFPEGQVTMACGRSDAGYVGVARLPDGRLDIAAALAPSAIPSGTNALGRLAARVFEENRLPVPYGLIEAPWSGTPTLTQRPRRLGSDRVLLIGDAAGYVEPFTGEGIGWALRSALEVQPYADAWIDGRLLDNRRGILELWERRHRATIGRWQRRCRAVCDLIGGRRATPAAVGVLSIAPWLARPVLRGIDPAPATA